MNFEVRANIGNVGHVTFSSYHTCCDATFYFYSSDLEETVIIDPFDKDLIYDRDFLKYILETCGSHMTILNSYFIDDMLDAIDAG